MLVRLNSTLRGQAGIHALAIDLPSGASVRDALTQAIMDHPTLHPILANDLGELRSDLVIFRNGRNIRFAEGIDTPLAGDDKLDLFPQTGTHRAFASDAYL